MSEGVRPTYCGNCGSPVQEDDRFCGSCGAVTAPPAQQAQQVIPRQVAAAQGAEFGGRRRARAWINAAMISLIVLLGVGAVAAFVFNDGLGLLGASDRSSTDDRGATPSQPEAVQEPTASGPTTSGSPFSDPSEPSWMSSEEIASLEEFGRDHDEAVGREDWEATYSMLDESSQQEFTEKEWAEKQQALAETTGSSALLESVNVEQEEQVADGPVTVRLSYEDGTEETITTIIPMVVEDESDSGVPKRYLTEEEVSELEQVSTSSSSSVSPANLEADAEEAAGDYYRAAGLEDWAYTYENLDDETQSGFTEEEWFQKNQWFADNGEVIYNIESASMVDGAQERLASVTLTLTYEDGSSSTRETYFVYEYGEWKHRFGEEENDLFMPDATFEEFVETQG